MLLFNYTNEHKASKSITNKIINFTIYVSISYSISPAFQVPDKTKSTKSLLKYSPYNQHFCRTNYYV